MDGAKQSQSKSTSKPSHKSILSSHVSEAHTGLGPIKGKPKSLMVGWIAEDKDPLVDAPPSATQRSIPQPPHKILKP
ncbi:hypothetical protein PS2_001470 [Malus domestica]